jgi:hypothetical protein
MTSGIDFSQYKRNPVVLWYHKRPKPFDGKNNNEVLPIGKGVKLWKDDGKLYADIEFDSEDKFAAMIEGKVDRGFIKMCSPGLDPITVSDDPKFILPGQTRATLIKSRLEEISIVDIGSNDNALRLNLNPDQDINDAIPLLNTFTLLKEKGMRKLIKFKKEQPDEYAKLYKAEYGIEPDMSDLVSSKSNTQTNPSEVSTPLTFAKLKEQGMKILEKFKAEKPDEYIKLFKAEYGFKPDMRD